MATSVSPALVLTSGVTVGFYRPSSANVTVIPQGTPIAGTNGTNGTNGSTIRSGTGAPTTGTPGVTGDYYIDQNYPVTLYGPRSSGGAWPLIMALVGPQGPSGSGINGFITGGM